MLPFPPPASFDRPLDLDVLLSRLRTMPRVVLELGCGKEKRPGAIGFDRLPLDGVDYVTDLEQGLGFLPDDSVDEICSSHVLEHVDNFEPLMRDVHRVLKPGGTMVAVVPHFSNPYYYSDFTHRRFFGLYTFDYMAERDGRYHRRVPDFYVSYKFRVLSRSLRFSSPFPWRYYVKRAEMRVFNLTPYMQELFESSFCQLFPCQELEFVLSPIK
jgi:SAM-dependent methyltransferase